MRRPTLLKHREKINIKKIVSDPKVFRKGVERYIEKIKDHELLKPIVVFKHPTQDLFAVLDGHHRFYALAESGMEEVDCLVIRSPIGFLFDKTKDGWFQPNPRFTRYVRIPVKAFATYINKFIKKPRELLKKSKERIKLGRLIFRKKELSPSAQATQVQT